MKGNFKYEAKIKVKIYSNKNENEYTFKIIENGENSSLEAIGENDISGLKIENTKNNLTVKNTNLKLEKIYENYRPITNNSLFLSSFSKDYNEENEVKNIEEKDSNVIKISLKNSSKYIKYKELYMNKESGMPEKLIIKNSDKQVVSCIEYINIEIL